MSLRARLLIGLIALTAIGLVVLAAVTYAEQRSFLLQRADQQVRAAVNPVSRQLDMQGANVEGGRDGGGPPPFGGGGPPPNVDLPPGTYGVRRDASGRQVGSPTNLTYGERALAPPRLPARLPVDEPVSVGSAGNSGLSYRALAVPTGDQPGVTIAAIPLRDVSSTLHRLLIVELAVIGAVLAAMAALSWWLVRLGLRPLDRIAQTAGTIAAGDLSRRVSPASERTEVGRLGLALNAMLAQIERAFAEREQSESRLRRFLADASHELRTPLVSIRGYAELFRLGATQAPGETEKAMRRIEAESARMGTLVEDLLTLARLDQVEERPRQAVDLGRLARDAVDDARAAAPDRDVELEADEQVGVLGDASQLRQVIANLVRNAVVHTPSGTPIEVRVEKRDGAATLTVRDHGPGLPSEDTDALFERFWRASGGRERGAAGAGLGLSIVAAVVKAHGGSVSAANAPGGGAAFTIRLPLSGAPAPAAAPA